MSGASRVRSPSGSPSRIEYNPDPEAVKAYRSVYEKRKALIEGENMSKVFDALAEIRADLLKD